MTQDAECKIPGGNTLDVENIGHQMKGRERERETENVRDSVNIPAGDESEPSQ